MNGPGGIHRALIWKEARQLLPLVYMLVGVTIGLFILQSIVGTLVHGVFDSMSTICLAMPAFFAAGVGAILVGQEKETQTLDWVSSLPITPRQTFLSKFAVAVIGLALMWVVATLGLMSDGYRSSSFMRSLFPDPFMLSLSAWIIHSVYLMCCGIYSSWRCKNVFSGLLLSLALACIPYVLGQISTWFYASKGFGYATDQVTLMASGIWSVLGILVVSVLAWRAAGHVLAPAEPPFVGASWLDSLTGESETLSLDQYSPPKSDFLPSQPFRFSLSALIWQSARNNQGKYLLMAALIFAGVGSLPLQSTILSKGSTLPLVLVIGHCLAMLAVSWLGVMSFVGEGSSPAMRFLADRGVSPLRAWWGRHLIALSIIASATLVYILCQWIVVSGAFASDKDDWGPMPMLSAIVILLALLGIYSLSQWTSQTMRVLAGTAFVAPLIASVIGYWLYSCWANMGTPPWILASVLLLPLVATATQMRRHMDGPRSIGFFVVHALTFLTIFVLPYPWCWNDTRSFPKIADARRAEILEASRQVSSSSQMPVQMYRRESPYEKRETFGLVNPRGSEILEKLEAVGQDPDDWLIIVGDETVPLSGDRWFVQQAVATAQLMQVRWMQSLKSDSDDAQQSQKHFLRWVESLSEMAARMRLSWRLHDQVSADRVEVVLTRMLARSETQQLRDQKVIGRAVAMLGDQSGRSAARRRAVLMSWNKFHFDRLVRNKQGLGGYSVSEYSRHLPPIQADWMVDPTADAITSELLYLIDAGQRGESTLSHRRELARLTGGDDPSLQQSPFSDRLQETLYIDQIGSSMSVPGSYWYAAWETEAKQLKQRLQGDSSDES